MVRKLKDYKDIIINNVLIKEDAATVHTDVASGETYTGELIGRVYQDTVIEQVCDIQPCIGPTGIIFYSYRGENGERKTGSKTFDLEKIETIDKFTKEWFQDFKASYGIEGEQWISKNVAWDAKDELDQRFFAYLHEIAEVKDTVTFTAGSAPLADEFFNLVGAAYKASSEIATDTKRGYEPYVICSPKVSAAISTVGLLALDENNSPSNRDYIGNIGKCRFYVDNTASEDFMIVGHKGFGMGNSSVIFTPYIVETIIADDYSVDESAVKIINRLGIIRHPSDSTGAADSKFVKKIPVDFSNLTNF